MLPTQSDISRFQEAVWEYFRAHARDMPWREKPEPYYVMVSELMLQQTQVSRVIPKFEAFIAVFPDLETLAAAPLSSVLELWSGLGYNRRAKFLHQTAQLLVNQNKNLLTTYEELVKLPGIGPNTAGAILNYAYNQPHVFIETNIRTVYLHHFFDGAVEPVNDTTLRRLVDMTIDTENPREWFWALMDYGAFLKKTAGGRLHQSSHYKKQPPLQGSLREMRGRIIKALSGAHMEEKELEKLVNADERYALALNALQREGMIECRNSSWCLTGHDLPS